MNKKEKEIKDLLKGYSVPKYNDDEPMRVIDSICNNPLVMPRFRTSNRQFIMSQIGFIRKRTWLLQAIVLVVLCLGFYKMSTESILNFRVFSLMSILSPLLLVVNIEEISRIYNRSMLEIEFSTKNSLRKVITTRMIIIGVSSCIALIITMMFVGCLANISILRVIMYTLVPFNIVCIGFLEMMKYFKGKTLNYACISYSTLLVAVFLFGGSRYLGIYENNFVSNWILVYTVTTVIFMFEIKGMWSRLGSFDEVVKERVI